MPYLCVLLALGVGGVMVGVGELVLVLVWEAMGVDWVLEHIELLWSSSISR